MPKTVNKPVAPVTGNPLYDAWKAKGFVRDRWRGWSRPENGNARAAINQIGNDHRDRNNLTSIYSWAIPSPEAIRWIAKKLSSIVEIGAGRGYWAKLLHEAGLDVVAYDPTVEGNDLNGNPWHSRPESIGLYYPVQKGHQSMAANHPDRTLFLCWPPYDDPMALGALESYQGGQFLYIGEGNGGCCGCDKFWSMIERDWEEVETFDIPQWPMIHDYMILYRHKERPAPVKRTRRITLE